ncbi:polymerase [Rhodoferax lacus]|uniref:Polymerase n=1 Tax=Rhodoferax lacus TaxID=2184758 RepID=A0A3E1RB15_9BURK|nr:Wzy polymerase domain-containing protein [Rhodoferax lacus]RFO96548.1 polymerase [Rhodoferax lacus]
MQVTAYLLLALPWLNPFTYGPTQPVVQFLSVWVAAALCGLLCLQARLKSADAVRIVATAWLLAAAVSACMGLLQYCGLAAAFGPWVDYVEAGQAYGNLRQRNQQATLLAIGLCALLWWQVQAEAAARTHAQGDALHEAQAPSQANRSRSWQTRGLIAFAASLLAAADAASGSRTGMLQLLLLLALGLYWQRASATLALALLVYAAAAVLLPNLAGLDPLHSGILGRLGEPASPCASRLTLWSNVLQLIVQKPWTGWGWGQLSYAHFETLYPGTRFCEILGNAHNLPLHLAVELGLPAAALLCGGALWLVLWARPWREQDATRQMAWSVLLVIGMHSLLEYPLWYAPFQLAAVLAVWLLWQTRPRQAPTLARAAEGGQSARSVIAVVVAALLLAACSYAAWDYWRISQIYLSAAQRDPAYRDDTLEKIRGSWLFADQVKFAELGTTPLTADNAPHIHALALQMLHFSPEASVVTKVIESASLLGLDEEAKHYMLRFKRAYPQDYAAWVKAQAAGKGGASGASDEAP